jgi:hypothetical protein
MVLVLLLILAAVVLGIIGTAAQGLSYLLAIGVVVLIAALVLGALRFRHGARRPTR